jgi:hypothetical protein
MAPHKGPPARSGKAAGLSLGSGRDADGCTWLEEVRLDSIDLRFADWDTFEPGVSISRLRMTANKQLLFESTPIVIVSLHALAR